MMRLTDRDLCRAQCIATLLLWCVALGLVLALTGCTTATGGAVWWNPTTWAARVAPASVDRAEEKRDAALEQKRAAEFAAVDAAHVEFAKSGQALAAAGDSRPVLLARRFNGTGLALLAQVRPLSAEEAMQLHNLVTDLLSENEQIRAAAEDSQRRAESAAAETGRELAAAVLNLERRASALAQANANLREAYDRENALANQVRNFWFVVGLLAFLWIAGNLLAVGARFVPALAPVSAAINGIAAPALAFAEARARDGLTKVGHAMATVREKLPEVAGRVVEIFDDHADTDHKRVIGAAAQTAPRES